MNLLLMLFLVLFVFGEVEAGTISRPSKTFGGTSFVNGVKPQASDFNGDVDTIYSEFNGNITNANVSASAAIDGSKIIPNWTSNQGVSNADPCFFLNENDQSADARRWYLCVAGGNFSLTTRTDAGVVQNTWFSVNRSNGSVALGGTSGTNTITGTTNIVGTFNFVPPGTMLAYGGATAPSGFNLCDGAALSRTTEANLFAVVGTTYGAGDGSTTFNVPNAKARNFLYAGANAGLTTRSNGQVGGTETHTLTIAELAIHSHTQNTATMHSPGGTSLSNNAGSTYDVSGQTTSTAGSSQAHPIIDPFLVVTCIIKK